MFVCLLIYQVYTQFLKYISLSLSYFNLLSPTTRLHPPTKISVLNDPLSQVYTTLVDHCHSITRHENVLFSDPSCRLDSKFNIFFTHTLFAKTPEQLELYPFHSIPPPPPPPPIEFFTPQILTHFSLHVLFIGHEHGRKFSLHVLGH